MEPTAFEGAKVREKDVDIAKNYLNEDEMPELNRVITMYLDFAEDQARRHNPMYMKDWETYLNNFLNMTGREAPSGSGHAQEVLQDDKAWQEKECSGNSGCKRTCLLYRGMMTENISMA